MFYLGVLAVGVLAGVGVFFVFGYSGWDVVGQHLLDSVLVVPDYVAEEVVEVGDYLGEAFHFCFGFGAACFGGDGGDFAVLVGECQLHGCAALHSVAVHVYGLEDALREVVFLGGGQFRHQKSQENRPLLPVFVAVGQHGRQELVGAHERFGFAFEIHLGIFAEVVAVSLYADVQQRV